MPDISVVIVDHNAAAYVRRAIASLPGAAGRYTAEVIVVDNSEAPQWQEDATRYIPMENRGFGAGCNRGAACATGELLLFLNPDSELSAGALEAAADCLYGHSGVGLVGLRTLLPDGREEGGALRGHPTPANALCYFLHLDRLFPHNRVCGGYHMTWLDRGVTGPVECVSGSFMLLRRALFEELGGFDERFFMYGEDLDLCRRVQEAGQSVWYCADGVMLHHHGKSGRSRRQTAAFYDSMLLYYDKYDQKRYSKLTGAAVKAAVGLMRRRALAELERER